MSTLEVVDKKDEDDQVILLDSLPYIESVHEDYEEYALALIEEEMKGITPRPMKKMAPVRFRTSLLQNEYQTLEWVQQESTGEDQTQQWVVMNTQRSSQDNHNMFQPVKVVPPTRVDEWPSSHALSQMKSRYESERLRGLSLEVELQEAISNWKDYNIHLDQWKLYWTRMLQERKDAVEEINFQRQQMQTQHVGPEINRLAQEYQQVLYRRNQLQHAIETGPPWK
jgi:hypothetical protein